MTLLIIARHGNTFGQGETPRRVGVRTDLPLVESGRAQAKAIGYWLQQNNIDPDAVYSSQLQRTFETANLALERAGLKKTVTSLAIFNEIDYGPDENLPEDAVISRVGAQALKDWDTHAIVPPGWNFDPDQCITDWKNFANGIVDDGRKCVMVVTSNGVARFAPHITNDFEDFARNHSIKISTGAVCVLQFEGGRWAVKDWNVKPTC